MLKGIVEIVQKNTFGIVIDEYEGPNMVTDDMLEYVLDFALGLHTWHDYKDEGEYTENDTGLWSTKRYCGAGLCMFNNSSSERGNGQNGISGGCCDYPMATTYLVVPEDSFLSNEVGSRVQINKTRRDQTVELIVEFQIPGDIATGLELREFGIFLGPTGPAHDPSYDDSSKPNTILCRMVRFGSGMCGEVPVYTDNPFVTEPGTIQFRWKVGEL